jgi:hypothetical protein
MKVRLLEGMWRHHIPVQMAERLKEAVDSADYEEIKSAAIDILEACKSLFDEEEDDYVIREIEDLIEEFSILDSSDDEDTVDYKLASFYDFMDGYKIWLGSDEGLRELGNDEDKETDA